MAEKITYKLKHVGINCENEKEAKQLVSLLCSLFDLEPGNEMTHTSSFPICSR